MPQGNPQSGMMARVRNRLGIVTDVNSFPSRDEGEVHFVRVEYTDYHDPKDEFILWEREPYPYLWEPYALPEVETDDPMEYGMFDALQRATRWSALTPFLDPSDPTKKSELTFSSPLFGAIKIDDFQIEPLLRALQMPRVSLLIADDVGLGKTVEAGLILRELLIRRRIRRVLILTPASLREQWKGEMKDRFSLDFTVIDRESTRELQKQHGFDANPWRMFDRAIASYHYLRQPDILESFLSTCRNTNASNTEASPQLPWDLIIVDEAHNLMPSNFGNDSQLAQMLRHISPWFEHRIFLTATPHNGYTRSFTGLLEQLDPVRFTQTAELTDVERERVNQVVIRRLKRDINSLDQTKGITPRFPQRTLTGVEIELSDSEKGLNKAVYNLRKKVRGLVSQGTRAEERAGSFAIEVLTKRLLSCPFTFADSWMRLKDGLKEQQSSGADEVDTARRAVYQDSDNDIEKQSRDVFASVTIGSWLTGMVYDIQEEIEEVDKYLDILGLNDDHEVPKNDTRYEKLVELIHDRLFIKGEWRNDERLIVFTEYKTTLDYIIRRLHMTFPHDTHRFEVLYGGMNTKEREIIKAEFNNPNADVRVLIGTDAASEGLNLQQTARLVFHYDIPWNPSRLEQRNGRLDRHGQPKDVEVFHFISDEDIDMKFLHKVVTKVQEMREDLGAVGEVFEAAFQRRFCEDIELAEIEQSLDKAIEKNRSPLPQLNQREDNRETLSYITKLTQEIDLNPKNLKETLAYAFEVSAKGVTNSHFIKGPDNRRRFHINPPVPSDWHTIIDDYVRIGTESGSTGALPGLVFDPDTLSIENGGRKVFHIPNDTLLVHLGHPLYAKALSTFARLRFPGAGVDVSRWTVRYGRIPQNCEAIVLLTVQEKAVNELRETFHDWVRTIALPIKDGTLGEPLPHNPPIFYEKQNEKGKHKTIEAARDIAADNVSKLRLVLKKIEKDRTETITRLLKKMKEEEQQIVREEYNKRIDEVKKAKQKTSINSLQKEREKLENELKQNYLLQEIYDEKREAFFNIDEELKRRIHNYENLLQFLKEEKDRTINKIIPKRFALRNSVQIQPVTLEILFPGEENE